VCEARIAFRDSRTYRRYLGYVMGEIMEQGGTLLA